MAEYYLISQLPSLDGIDEHTPVPITKERFDELCSRFLSGKARKLLQRVTISPSLSCENSGSTLIDTWIKSEQDLRLALAVVRAEKMKVQFDLQGRILQQECIKTASYAAEMTNPLEAEKFLNEHRLNVLESLRPTDTFSDEYIFYYGIKLELLQRIRSLDTNVGEEVYRNIYNSILNGDGLEVTR